MTSDETNNNNNSTKVKPPSALFAALNSGSAKKKLRKVKKSELATKKVNTEIPPQKYKPNKALTPKVILVIGFQTNWYNQFKDAALSDGTPLQIEQTLWPYIDLEASSNPACRLVVDLQPNSGPIPFTSQCKARKTRPDFVVIRNFPTDIHGDSFQNLLLGFMFSGVPSMNIWNTIFFGMQRPLMYAALHRLRLPMVPMTYHPNFSARTDRLLLQSEAGSVPFPKVIKVSSTHSGYGKIRVRSESEMADVKSILILNKDFYTEETLLENIDFEYRIQKIGGHYRAFKRISSNSWKNNWGNIQFVDYELEAKHIEWVDRAASIYGGLDICALDVLKLQDENGSEVILELNGTACGLMAEHETEDASYIRDLVIDRMSGIYCKNRDDNNNNASQAVIESTHKNNNDNSGVMDDNDLKEDPNGIFIQQESNSNNNNNNSSDNAVIDPNALFTVGERAAITRLMDMGFKEYQVIQAYAVCNKNEASTINLLLNQNTRTN